MWCSSYAPTSTNVTFSGCEANPGLLPAHRASAALHSRACWLLGISHAAPRTDMIIIIHHASSVGRGLASRLSGILELAAES